MPHPFIGEADPKSIAWIEPCRHPLPFGDLAERAGALSRRLSRVGIPDGAIIATTSIPPLELVTLILAVLPRWSVAPLGGQMGPEERAPLLKALSPCAILGDELEVFPGGQGRATPGSLCLVTSATTGRSKIVPRSAAQLTVSARDTRNAFALSPRDRFLCMMPMHHLQALGCIFAQWVAGGSVVHVPEFDAAQFARWLREFAPTWYSASPAIHDAILRMPDEELHPLRFIHSVGAPLPGSTMERLSERFHAPVIESYGLTETGIVTSNPLPPAVSRPGTVGLPVGPEIRVSSEGEILVRGPSLFREYLQIREPVFDPAGWFHTGDLGVFDAGGYLRILGRCKEVINRGGEKIIPDEIDRVIESHPSVTEAAAFSVPHPTLGEDIAVAVTCARGSSLTASELIAYCRERVSRERCPHQIVFVDRIPRGETGKPLRRLLTLPARAASDLDGIPSRVLELWSDALGRQPSSASDNFYSQGGDSLIAATLLSATAAEFGVPLESLDEFFDQPSPGGLAALVRTPHSGPLSRPRLTYYPNAAASPLYLVASAAEHAFALRPLVHAMGRARPVVVLLTSGCVQDRGPGHVAACAEQTVRELRRAHSGGPYSLAGYCYGGIVAARAAALLRRDGTAVGGLVLIDAPCPGPKRLHPRWSFAGRIAPLPARRGPVDTEPPPVDVHVHQILASRPRVSTLLLEDPRLTWRRFAKRSFTAHKVVATHESILQDPAVVILARLINSLLG